MWSETYTIGHNEGVTGRVVLLGLVATVGCDASLGAGGDPYEDAAVDAKRVDAAPADAAPDARMCTQGTGAALAPDGSCLVQLTTAMTYVNAKAACAASGWHLAYIKDAALDTFAENFVGTVNTWIGANDIATEGTFKWEDGTAFLYTNWYPTTMEPNNGNGNYQEDCVIIAGARVGKQWDDRPCDATQVMTSGMFAALCQY
jgi:hypothetical protein